MRQATATAPRRPEPGASATRPEPEPWTRPALGPRDRAFTLAGVLISLLLAGIDHTIVATAGPAIQEDLRIRASLYAWLTTAYLVTSTVMLPVYGKLSDLYGRKPILLIGVSLFLLGSLLAGLSPSTGMLIGARAVQGLGAASLFTSALAVIADLYPPHLRGRYMGLLSGTMGVSSVVGPLVGGVITDTLGWHWAFFVNLPIGAVAIWLIATRMPRLGGRPRTARVDVAGAVALVVAVVPLLVLVSLLGGEGGGGATGGAGLAGALGALGLAGTVAFVAIERRAADPILDLRLFRNRVIGVATAAQFAQGVVFLFSMVFLPLFLVNVVGVSATGAGVALLPLMAGMVTGSIGAGQLVSRYGGGRRLLLGSLGVLALAFSLLGFVLSPDSSHVSVALMMVLVGLGFGPSLPLYTLAVQNTADSRDIGVVTAASTFARSMGQVLGVTAFGAVFAYALGPARADAAVSMALVPDATLTEALQWLYRIGLAFIAITFALTLRIPASATDGRGE